MEVKAKDLKLISFMNTLKPGTNEEMISRCTQTSENKFDKWRKANPNMIILQIIEWQDMFQQIKVYYKEK